MLNESEVISKLEETENFMKLEKSKGYLISDHWDFDLIVPPTLNAVYFPGEAFMKARLTGVDINLDNESLKSSSGTITLHFTDREDQAITAFIYDWIRKFNFFLKRIDIIAFIYNWMCTHSYVLRKDGIITFIYNWIRKINSFLSNKDILAFIYDWIRKHGSAIRKGDITAEAKLIMYNTSRKLIRTYTMHDLIPCDTKKVLSISFDSAEPRNNGILSFQLKSNHIDIEFLNDKTEILKDEF